MSVFFDVGANNGGWSIYLARNNPNFKVYAFEPTPHLCQIIKSAANDLKNYRLTEKAVSDFEGIAEFKIAGQADWGCSSLLDFSEKIQDGVARAHRLKGDADNSGRSD